MQSLPSPLFSSTTSFHSSRTLRCSCRPSTGRFPPPFIKGGPRTPGAAARLRPPSTDHHHRPPPRQVNAKSGKSCRIHSDTDLLLTVLVFFFLGGGGGGSEGREVLGFCSATGWKEHHLREPCRSGPRTGGHLTTPLPARAIRPPRTALPARRMRPGPPPCPARARHSPPPLHVGRPSAGPRLSAAEPRR